MIVHVRMSILRWSSYFQSIVFGRRRSHGHMSSGSPLIALILSFVRANEFNRSRSISTTVFT
jgi:hypothetical protein